MAGRIVGRTPTSSILASLFLCALPAFAGPASAQAPSPDPAAWRPFAYANLRIPSATTATYADLWREVIDGDNRAYSARRDTWSRGGNAPAIEAHFVIWSATRSVVLSILDTMAGCIEKARIRDAGAIVRLCPMRVAIYEGVAVRTFEAGRGCMLELTPSADHASPADDPAAAYASYDVAARTIHIGLIVDHRPVEGCSLSIPLRPSTPGSTRSLP